MSPPSPFEVCAVSLEEVTWEHHPRWTFARAGIDPGSGEWEGEWRKREHELRPFLDATARAWVSSREWPDLSPEAEYFFLLRFVAASRFVHQFPTDSQSLFKFPAAPMPLVLQWLLVAWWASIGCMEAMMYAQDIGYDASRL